MGPSISIMKSTKCEKGNKGMPYKQTVHGSSRERIKLQFLRKLQFTLPSTVQCMQNKTDAGPLGALLREERIFLTAQNGRTDMPNMLSTRN